MALASPNTEEATPVTVLFVDDEKVIADTMSLILRQSGITTLAAYEGDEAIEMTRRHQPKIIFMNVYMPRMNGVAAAIQIRNEFPEIKIVMHSGNKEAVEPVREHGFGVCVPKPFPPQRIFEILAEHGIRPRNIY